MEQQVAEQLLDWVRNHYFGKYRGTVPPNGESTNRGRIPVRVPAVLKDQEVWAMPCLPYIGKGSGSYWIPATGAAVWVEFEAGNPSFPIWSGGFWADGALPENEQGTGATPSLRIFRSEQGMIVSLDDDAKVITISDQDGSNIITVDVQQNEIKIKATQKIVIDAPAIELVENSTHPLVFGDSLLEYLQQVVTIYQSHTHPGEMAAGILPVTPAPPVPPMPPPTPELLSFIVTTG